MYNVQIICDSICNGQRLTTVSLTYPRFIHSEFLRHRMLSHSVESSRAVPTEKLLERIMEQPFVPETFNKRVKGMGVGDALDEWDQNQAVEFWMSARDYAYGCARGISNLDVDKSRVNRLLEPFMFVTDLVTGTDWDNFFALRDHEAAQPEFQKIAGMMRDAFETSEPIELDPWEWHLPLIRYEDEFCEANDTKHWEYFAYVSAGRCCRWSYGVDPKVAMEEHRDTSYERADRLVQSFHMSPFEHQAQPFTKEEIYCSEVAKAALPLMSPSLDEDLVKGWMKSLEYSGNLRYWKQFRKSFDNESNFALA